MASSSKPADLGEQRVDPLGDEPLEVVAAERRRLAVRRQLVLQGRDLGVVEEPLDDDAPLAVERRRPPRRRWPRPGWQPHQLPHGRDRTPARGSRPRAPWVGRRHGSHRHHRHRRRRRPDRRHRRARRRRRDRGPSRGGPLPRRRDPRPAPRSAAWTPTVRPPRRTSGPPAPSASGWPPSSSASRPSAGAPEADDLHDQADEIDPDVDTTTRDEDARRLTVDRRRAGRRRADLPTASRSARPAPSSAILGRWPPSRSVPLFDFDGTLVDSDVALTAPWHALGVDPDLVPLGLPLVRGLRASRRDRRGLPRALRPDRGPALRRGGGAARAGSTAGGWPRTRSARSGRRELRPARVGAGGGAVLRRLRRGGEGSSARSSTRSGLDAGRGRVRRRHAPRPRLRGRGRACRFALAGWNAASAEPAPSRTTWCSTQPGRRPRPALSRPDQELEHVLVSSGMAQDLPLIISVDDHVVEPPTLWTDRLPAKYLDRAPAGGARHGQVPLRGRRVLLREGRRGRRAGATGGSTTTSSTRSPS